MLRCYDRKAAEVLIQSYVNTWRRMGVEVDEENEEAKVELEAYRSGNDEAARQQISELWLRTKESGT